MILSVLHVFFLKFEPELLFICSVFFKLVIVVAHRLHILLQHFLSVYLFLNLGLKHSLDLIHFFEMLVCDLCNQNSVISLAAVFKQNLIHLPDSCDDLEIILSRRENLLEQLEKADRIDE